MTSHLDKRSDWLVKNGRSPRAHGRESVNHWKTAHTTTHDTREPSRDAFLYASGRRVFRVRRNLSVIKASLKIASNEDSTHRPLSTHLPLRPPHSSSGDKTPPSVCPKFFEFANFSCPFEATFLGYQREKRKKKEKKMVAQNKQEKSTVMYKYVPPK